MKHFDLENDKKIDTGFKIPDQYFDSFEDRLMHILPQEEKEVITLWQRKSAWISSVAAVFIVAFGTWTYFANQSADDLTVSQEYLAYESDITTEDIAQHLTNEDISALETELNTFDSKTEKYITEYLN
ncbi:MAG: hypothetical protein V4670_04840 [Bacteroidota bacterium]